MNLRDIIRKESKCRELLQDTYLNEALIFQWTVEIFDALSHLHSHRIIHRNIKPEFRFLFLFSYIRKSRN